MTFDRILSFGLSVFWSVLSLVGYYLLDWKLGETILFINLGFISFFLNYFLLFSWLSFKGYILVGPRKQSNDDSFMIWRLITGIVQHSWNQFLFVCALLLFSSMSIVFTALFFSLSETESLTQIGMYDFTRSFIWLALAGLVFAGAEFLRFLRRYNAARTDEQKVFDWKALKIFHRNHLKKLNMYYFGSILALLVDAVRSDEFREGGGTICLFWLFALHIYWAFVDWRFPVGTIAPVPEHLREFEQEEEDAADLP